MKHFLILISNRDNYYTQVIATVTSWKEAISWVEEIASYRRNDDYSTGFYMNQADLISKESSLLFQVSG